jgi:CubicO group peptidase (beta-lactamase class C family)
MKPVTLLAQVAFVASLLAGPSAWAENVPPAIQSEIARIMQRARVPGLVIAKVEKGAILWHAAVGERAPGEPMTLDTRFNVASLTKPVFATAVLSLVADDELALDEKVSAHWTDPDVTGDPRHDQLTPRLLLSHQSGFPNWRGKNPLAFLFSPGERHEYSGEGFEYLRRALERKTGKSLHELLAERVFQPANMRSTSSGWSESIGKNVARGFDESGKPIDTGLESRGPNAAANLMSTIDDYARFMAWVSRGADLPEALFAQMNRSQAAHAEPAELFGLGWKLIPLKNETALMHDGRESGVRTWALVQPASREALVILTNSSNGELTFRPLVKAALRDGNELMASADALVWRYLQHLPSEALPHMSKRIARSPSFLATLLHAVDTVLIQTSGLTRGQKHEAAARVDEFVFACLEGKVDVDRAEQLVARLLVKEGDAIRLRGGFDAEAVREWVEALRL